MNAVAPEATANGEGFTAFARRERGLPLHRGEPVRIGPDGCYNELAEDFAQFARPDEKKLFDA